MLYTDNYDLLIPVPETLQFKQQPSDVGVIVGGIIGFLVLVGTVITVAAFLLRRHKRKKGAQPERPCFSNSIPSHAPSKEVRKFVHYA